MSDEKKKDGVLKKAAKSVLKSNEKKETAKPLGKRPKKVEEKAEIKKPKLNAEKKHNYPGTNNIKRTVIEDDKGE